MPFGVLINRSGTTVLLGLSGEFTSEAGQPFEEAIEEIANEPFNDLIVDLSGLTYVDSSAAFLLHQLYKRFSGQSNVVFEGGSAETQRLFESAGLTGVLPISFPGAAYPSQPAGPGPGHDFTDDPTHPHRPVPYVGIPRPGGALHRRS